MQEKSITTTTDQVKGALEKRKFKPLTHQVKNKICKMIEETGDWRTAIATLSISRVAFKNALKKDVQLAERVEMAEGKYLAGLEAEARRRAVEGVEKGIYYKGDRIATEREYSDKLLDKLMTAADKEKYSKQTSVKNDTNINVTQEGLRKKLAGMLGIDYEQSPIPIEDEALEGEFREG